ncbi:MAG: response regulator [Desulfobacteraceae bacterium]|jgi:chemosensory pili system protein ChpA (sensor histidine kinase/response regulator)
MGNTLSPQKPEGFDQAAASGRVILFTTVEEEPIRRELMSGALTEDMASEFIIELKGYILQLRDKADKLNRRAPGSSDVHLVEFHRLIHAIRGASALLKLNNLSEVASKLETIFEKIISGDLTFDTCVYRAAVDTIEYFDAYTQQSPCNDTFNLELRAERLDALGDILKDAPSEDEQDFLLQLFQAASKVENDDLDASPQRRPGPPEPSRVDAQESGGAAADPIDLAHGELLEDFYQEAEDHFQDLGRAIGQLEEHVGTPTAMGPKHKELLRLIKRSVHTIKGAAAVIKLKPVASWGHEFEDLLDWLYEDADLLTPDAVDIIADAADMLEQFVIDPRKTDPRQLDRLRVAFKRIIGPGEQGENISPIETQSEPARKQSECVEIILPDDNQKDRDRPSHAPDPTRPIRVDFAKLKSLVNLGGELTIALSAFDQDIDALGNLIQEIDQTQSRLKKTARDLELGYEHKAIGAVYAAGPIIENSSAIVGEKAATYSEFDPMELDRFSELNLIIRSLNETATDAGTISQQLSKTHTGLKGYLHHLRLLLAELNEKTMRMRMTPMSSIANRLRRTVRETASQLDKKVRLTLQGENIELDKMVWDKLADPLMHLLRNAVDHGIEPLVKRQASGKPEIASIRLTAAQKGNRVVLRISDDGPGLDYEAIRNAFVSPTSGKDKEAITRQELTEIIFQPGFSTRQTISEVSGRGVGLDVVKESIMGLKGSVHVEQSESTGTTFCINLPLTMAVSKALIFDIGGQPYATPLCDIKEVVRVNPRHVASQEDNTIYISGRRLAYYELSEILSSPGLEAKAGHNDMWPLILIVEKESWQAAVAIDRIHNQRDIVLKSLGSHLAHVKGISGATIMGDGKVVPIVDFEELLDIETDQRHENMQFKHREVIQRPLEIMVVDDSVTIRNVVSRLMQRQGWQVVTARDGAAAFEVLHTRRPDLIILDIEMPRMNGYEFLSQIRTQEKFADLPVIMHTSRASKKHREKAGKLGADAFVTKPFDEQDLIAQVIELSRKSQTLSQSEEIN